MKGTIEIAIVYCSQGLTIFGVDFNKVALSLFIVYAWQLAWFLLVCSDVARVDVCCLLVGFSSSSASVADLLQVWMSSSN